MDIKTTCPSTCEQINYKAYNLSTSWSFWKIWVIMKLKWLSDIVTAYQKVVLMLSIYTMSKHLICNALNSCINLNCETAFLTLINVFLSFNSMVIFYHIFSNKLPHGYIKLISFPFLLILLKYSPNLKSVVDLKDGWTSCLNLDLLEI